MSPQSPDPYWRNRHPFVANADFHVALHNQI
ncbi:hypothetical protein SKA58_08499 [Sphingomonas sp. SKA58]|nr:hypothetical protein SKA58_08499 [Sphingomonas sp. SKA58]